MKLPVWIGAVALMIIAAGVVFACVEEYKASQLPQITISHDSGL